MSAKPLILGLLSLTLTACANGTGAGAPSGADSAQRNHSNRADAESLPTNKPLAYVAGRPVVWGQLQTLLLEAQGGAVLTEVVLDRAIADELEQRGMTVSDAMVEREREILMTNLSASPDTSVQLLRDLRERRGLGEVRFRQLLQRNAGLRLLVANEVEVTEAAIRQLHSLEYGPRYQARLIVAISFADASRAAQQARQGVAFESLVAMMSIDPSRDQGGQLSPMNLEDPSYPAAVRAALGRLQPGDVSDPIALDRGYAVLRLERIIPGNTVDLESVRDRLTARVRVQVEQMLMQRRARTLLDRADVVPLDPALARSWKQQRDAYRVVQ